MEPDRPDLRRGDHGHRDGADHRHPQHRPLGRVDARFPGDVHGPAPGRVAPPVDRVRPVVHLDHRPRCRDPPRRSHRIAPRVRRRLRRGALFHRHSGWIAGLAWPRLAAGQWKDHRPHGHDFPAARRWGQGHGWRHDQLDHRHRGVDCDRPASHQPTTESPQVRIQSSAALGGRCTDGDGAGHRSRGRLRAQPVLHARGPGHELRRGQWSRVAARGSGDTVRDCQPHW